MSDDCASGVVQGSPDVVAKQVGEKESEIRHQVTIYVTAHCANCDYAGEVAASIRRKYPHVAVQLVDLADPQEPVPDVVFATPTYLLDGRVWSLGNPSPEQIEATLG
ncbi:MAG: thioredoxin family protein [Caldilinea sp.]